MPLTYFKCVDTLLAYCNKSIPANQKNRPFGLRDFVEFVILHNFYIGVFYWFLIA